MNQWSSRQTSNYDRDNVKKCCLIDSMALKQLCDMFTKHQFSKVKANAITARHFNDQVTSLNKLMAFLGQGRRIKGKIQTS